jgi:hypothetical protein
LPHQLSDYRMRLANLRRIAPAFAFGSAGEVIATAPVASIWHQ